MNQFIQANLISVVPLLLLGNVVLSIIVYRLNKNSKKPKKKNFISFGGRDT